MTWVKPYWQAINNAMGVKRYVVLSVASTASAFYPELRDWVGILPELNRGVPFLFVMVGTLFLCSWGRNVELEKKTRSDLEVTYARREPYITTEGDGLRGPLFRVVRIRVTNTGGDKLDGCIAKLISIRDKNGAPGAYTPIGLATQHQQGERRSGGRFALSAGEPKYVNIAYQDEMNAESEIQLAYETLDNGMPAYHSGIRADLAPYSTVIAVFGSNVPVYRHFILEFDGAGHLSMREEPLDESHL